MKNLQLLEKVAQKLVNYSCELKKGHKVYIEIIDGDNDFLDLLLNEIKKALSIDFRDSIKTMHYKFGDGKSAEKMVNIIKSLKVDEKLIRKKLDFPGEKDGKKIHKFQ